MARDVARNSYARNRGRCGLRPARPRSCETRISGLMMTQDPTNPDVIVIGAGAAGIGAGRLLARAKIPFLIIEGKGRIGGRAYSDTTSLGYLWDQGCHWLHSANKNILRELAEEIGHRFLVRERSPIRKSFMNGAWTSDPAREDFVWG